MRFAYYPGCVAQTSGKELDMSTRLVAKKLEIELVDIPSFSCCGGGVIDEANMTLNLALNARNLALAESKGLDVLTICSTCQGMMARSVCMLKEDEKLSSRVASMLEKIGMRYEGKTKVKHLLQVLVEGDGLNKIKNQVVKPLRGLKIAPFYGCHLLRPADIIQFDDPYDPNSFEDLIRALGAEPVKFEGRVKCCGFSILFVKENAANKMAGLRIKEAVDEGADVMATPCPLCHISLDTYQSSAVKEIGENIQLPILHLPQLLGLAFDFKKEELGLSRHMVPPDSLLKKLL